MLGNHTKRIGRQDAASVIWKFVLTFDQTLIYSEGYNGQDVVYSVDIGYFNFPQTFGCKLPHF